MRFRHFIVCLNYWPGLSGHSFSTSGKNNTTESYNKGYLNIFLPICHIQQIVGFFLPKKVFIGWHLTVFLQHSHCSKVASKTVSQVLLYC